MEHAANKIYKKKKKKKKILLLQLLACHTVM
jgi:hypothetical protein